MSSWSFLTNHARVLLAIADDPDARLRDLADALNLTERTVFGIVNDLAEAGYIVKEREGRRNRYHIPGAPPTPDRRRTEAYDLGEVLGAADSPPSAALPIDERRRRRNDPPRDTDNVR